LFANKKPFEGCRAENKQHHMILNHLHCLGHVIYSCTYIFLGVIPSWKWKNLPKWDPHHPTRAV